MGVLKEFQASEQHVFSDVLHLPLILLIFCMSSFSAVHKMFFPLSMGGTLKYTPHPVFES